MCVFKKLRPTHVFTGNSTFLWFYRVPGFVFLNARLVSQRGRGIVRAYWPLEARLECIVCGSHEGVCIDNRTMVVREGCVGAKVRRICDNNSTSSCFLSFSSRHWVELVRCSKDFQHLFAPEACRRLIRSSSNSTNPLQAARHTNSKPGHVHPQSHDRIRQARCTSHNDHTHRRSSTRFRGSTIHTSHGPHDRHCFRVNKNSTRHMLYRSPIKKVYTSLRAINVRHLGAATSYKRVEAASRSGQKHGDILLRKKEARRLVIRSRSKVGVVLSSEIPAASFPRHGRTMT